MGHDKYNFNSLTYRSGGAAQGQLSNTELGVYLHLNEVDLLRLQMYTRNWDYYEGRQWEFERDDGDPLVTKNYIEFVLNKAVSWLAQNGFKNKVPESLKDFVGAFLDNVWKANNRQIKTIEIALVGAVAGDCYVFVTVERPKEGKILDETNIKIVILNERYVFPIFDPENKEEMIACKIETFVYEQDENSLINSKSMEVRGALKRFTQIITKDKILEQYEGQQPVIKDNVLGEIPIVHIKNLPNPHGFFGKSDVTSLLNLQKDLNEKSTDVSDIIAYHSSPIMLLYGAKVSQIERTFKSFWTGLPLDSKFEIANSNADLANANAYIATTKSDIFTISETPSILAESKPISNTSGVALSMEYLPIVQKTARKRPYYERGFQKINYLILKYAELLKLIYLPKDMCSKCRGKVIRVLDKNSEFPRLVNRCYLVDENFVLVGPDKAKKILGLEEVETETIDLSTYTQDPSTGEIQITENKQFVAVPNNCRVSKIQDPYDIPVEILDALPRDEQLNADYWIKLKQEGLVSKRFVLTQLATIPEDMIDDILLQLKQELEDDLKREAALAALGQKTDSGNNVTPGTKELEGQISKRQGHNTPNKDPEGQNPGG